MGRPFWMAPYFLALQGSKPLFFPSEFNTLTFSSSRLINYFTSARRPGVATPTLAQEWVKSPGQIRTVHKYRKSKNIHEVLVFGVGQKCLGQPIYSTLTLSTFRVPNPYFPKKFRVHPYRGDSYGGG